MIASTIPEWLGKELTDTHSGACTRTVLSAVISGLAMALCSTTVLAGETEVSHADPVVQYSFDYTLDVMGVQNGGASHKTRHLDALSLAADIDLDRAIGWNGSSAHLELSNTSGDTPSADLGNLQGVDGIEASAHRLVLYQAYLEQSYRDDRINLRIGFSDVSGEFATADTSGYLINPSFGMAPEFAATVTAVYPSGAFGGRVKVRPTDNTYVQIAVTNARAGVAGEHGGADFSFRDGEAILAEGGWTGRGKVAFGYWMLTHKQDHVFKTDLAGDPVKKRAQGAWLVAEQPLILPEDNGRSVNGFVRLGVSEGQTQVFKSSIQAGVLVQPVFKSRPDSVASFGVADATIGSAWRQASAAGGLNLARHETVYELTYADQLTPWLSLQPDLQYIVRPGGDPTAKNELVVGLRANIAF
jgi:porin